MIGSRSRPPTRWAGSARRRSRPYRASSPPTAPWRAADAPRALACTRCDHREEVEDFARLDVPPTCPRCGAVVRPDVVPFGEELPVEKLALLRRETGRGFDLVFSVGTSSVFPYIAEPVLRARSAGIPTVEINPGRSEVSDVMDIRIAAGAALALGLLWDRYLARQEPG